MAYQGRRGSYCQEAAAKAFNVSPFDSLIPCTSMEDAFLSLENLSADRAVVPAENSLDGPIDRNLDLLLRHEDVKIVGEVILPVDHCLLSLPDASISDICRIVSHPQALRHCSERIRELDVDVDEVDNVAEAARFVSEYGIFDTAVIGSRIAAKEFGLRVLECNFQDLEVNYNRYLQLGFGLDSGCWEGTVTKKTTVAFSLDNGASDLFRAMCVFEAGGIKVTRVEQRPNKKNPVRVVEKENGKGGYLDYVFVLDLEGCWSEMKVKKAITGLEKFAGFVRVLGSYASRYGNI